MSDINFYLHAGRQKGGGGCNQDNNLEAFSCSVYLHKCWSPDSSQNYNLLLAFRNKNVCVECALSVRHPSLPSVLLAMTMISIT